jgi:diguanylate cyclase (GGDEF)-like protein
LFNRRYLEETLEREWARARRHQLELALAIIDIDHFKQVNDTYGHLAGDQVLGALGALVRENCRAEDVPCRYGGEEFIVILLETALPNAHARAERWRAMFEQLHTRWDHHAIHTTISIGLAISPAHADNAQQLIARADQALYRAKQAGRNRVIAYTPD